MYDGKDLTIGAIIFLQGSRSDNDEIGSSSRQFLFDYKVVNGALDNLLVIGSEIFINLSIKRGVRKLPQSFFLVEVGPPNNQSDPLCRLFGQL